MKKLAASVALTAMAFGLLAGCATVGLPASFTPGSQLVIGESASLVSLNSGLATTPASESAATDIATLTMPAFYSADASGKLVANKAFGSIRYTAGSISFTLAGKAKWSDGAAVTTTDLLLSYKAATAPATVGFNSRLVGTSLAQTSEPKVSGNTLTLSHSAPIADWQTMLPITVPAHILQAQNYGGTKLSASDADAAVSKTLLSGSAAELSTLAAAYANVGTASDLSAGAYSISSVKPNTVQLAANKNYAFGPKPTVAKLTFKFFNSTDALVAAISAKKIDLAAPIQTPSQSTAQIESAAKATGLSVVHANWGMSEDILLNHSNQSVFSVAGAGGPKKALAAQSAFFQFAPRAGIWTALLGDASLTKTDSLVFASGTSDYSASVSQNGSSAYQFQNGEAAAEAWKAAGYLRTIPVRVLFDSNNPRAQLEYTQLSQWGKAAGFTIQNVSTDVPDSVLASGNWDVYIIDQPRLGASLASLSTASGALTSLNAPAINAIVAKIATSASFEGKAAALANLDQQLFENFYGLPVFELQSVVVHSKKLASFTASSSSGTLVSGYSNWAVSASGK